MVTNGFVCREAEDGVEALSIMSLSMNARKRLGMVAGGDDSSGNGSNSNGGSSHGGVIGSIARIVAAPPPQPGSASTTFRRQSLVEIIDAVLIDSNMPRMNGPGQSYTYHISSPIH